jgi:hypothetical protein
VRDRTSWARSIAAGVVAALLTIVGFVAASGGGAASGSTTTTGSLGGSAGDVVTLPDGPTPVDATGTGDFASLHVHVNQTQNLVNQAISVSWTGGTPSTMINGEIADNYLQLMECWGDDGTGTGPSPSQCEFGAEAPSITTSGVNPNPGAYPIPSWTWAVTRILSKPGLICTAQAYAGCESYDQLAQAATTNPAAAYVDASQGSEALMPFQPVSGQLVPVTTDELCCLFPPPWANSWNENSWFDHTTSNEVDLARTYPDGTGQVLFQVDTGEEAPGLGCGQAQSLPDGSTGPPPKCWLVIMPRGSPARENPPGQTTGVGTPVQTSPLSPGIWNNRIAIPLGFLPVGTGCGSGTASRLLGGEMAAAAVHNWQPSLCAAQTSTSYLYTGLSDDSVRSGMLNPAPDVIGGVVTDPIDPSLNDPTNPFVYAPLTLSGVAIAVNIQRSPFDPKTGGIPPDEVPFTGRPVTQLNLTPRLVAKLLTESYLGSMGPAGAPPSYVQAWAAKNATSIFNDQDFLQYNPEFAELRTPYPVDSSQLVASLPSSDAAALVWQWILGDPAAKAWLAGTPDQWGMEVNPNYSTATTGPEADPLGAFQPTNTYPKNDPYCFVPSGPNYQLGGSPPSEARNLCQQDWAPYQNSMSAAAASVSTANSGSHTTFNPSAPSADTAWSADGPETYQQHAILGLTTTDQAARYGLPVAALSQDGNDTTPTFIAPNQSGLLAGASAMQPSAVSGVVDPNPTTTAAGAYPLSILSYAVVTPLALSSTGQQAASAFLSYAAGAGQTPGFNLGNLPPGYVPLPSSFSAETTQAAATVLNPASLEPTTTTTTSISAAPTPTPVATTAAPVAAPASAPAAPAASAPAPAASAATPTATATATATPTATTTPPPTTALPRPTATVAPPARSPGRTPGGGAGLPGWGLGIALLVGLGTAGMSQVLLRR